MSSSMACGGRRSPAPHAAACSVPRACDHQGRERFTGHVFRDDDSGRLARATCSSRQQVLIELMSSSRDQMTGSRAPLPALGIGDEVGREVAAVELHASTFERGLHDFASSTVMTRPLPTFSIAFREICRCVALLARWSRLAMASPLTGFQLLQLSTIIPRPSRCRLSSIGLASGDDVLRALTEDRLAARWRWWCRRRRCRGLAPLHGPSGRPCLERSFSRFPSGDGDAVLVMWGAELLQDDLRPWTRVTFTAFGEGVDARRIA